MAATFKKYSSFFNWFKLFPAALTDIIRDRVAQPRRKLFVRNLAPITTSEDVRVAFQRHGVLEEGIRVIV